MDNFIELISYSTIYDYISWGCAITSVVSAITAFYQAFKIKKYREVIIVDLRKITIHKACDLLRKAQADCRKLLSNNRGQSNDEIYVALQESIDLSINELNQEARDSDIINGILESSAELKRIWENNESASKLHDLLGNAIIQCNQIIGEIR